MNGVSPPVFSVIIPTYNRAAVVGRAIRSVLDQSFAQFELIVVDDGSADETAQVVAGFTDARVRYMYQENAGVSAARNSGVALARGQYLTFLDSDDEALPEWLAEFDRLLQPEDVGVACCGFFIHVVGQRERLGPYLPEDHGDLMSGCRCSFLAGLFTVRREIFWAAGGYDEKMTYSENTELGIRLAAYCAANGLRIVSVDRPLAIYHRDPTGGARTSGNWQKSLRSVEIILDRHGDRLRRDPRTYGNYLASAGVYAAKLGDYALARRYFESAVKADMANWRHYVRLGMAAISPLGRAVWLRHERKR